MNMTRETVISYLMSIYGKKFFGMLNASIRLSNNF